MIPPDALRREVSHAYALALIATLNELAHPVSRDSEEEDAETQEIAQADAA